MRTISACAALAAIVATLPACRTGPRLAVAETEERAGLRYAAGSETPFTGTLVAHADTGGRLLLEARYRAGVLEGRRREWFPSGQLRREEVYRAGARHGVVETWHPNGRKAGTATYENGQLRGPLQRWYDTGQAEYEGTYVRGYADGPSQEWYRNGQVKRRATWLAGRPDSTFATWYEDGRPQLEGHYRDGALRELRRWDAQGVLSVDTAPGGVRADTAVF